MTNCTDSRYSRQQTVSLDVVVALGAPQDKDLSKALIAGPTASAKVWKARRNLQRP